MIHELSRVGVLQGIALQARKAMPFEATLRFSIIVGMGVDMLIDSTVTALGRKAYSRRGRNPINNYEMGDTHPSYNRILDTLASLLPDAGDKVVLDLAAGLGEQARYLEGLGLKTIRSDLSDDAVRSNQRSDETAGVVQALMWRLPFDDGSFAGVHLKDALVHAADKDKLFAELSRVMVTGGGVMCIQCCS